MSKSAKRVSAADARRVLRDLGDPAIAEHSQRFFKTGPGEYGEGDRFLGIRVPVLRKQTAAFAAMPLSQVLSLLRSRYHEERLFALLLMVRQYSKSNDAGKTKIYEKYLENTGYINNWDLVDTSAHAIVGAYLFERDREPLFQLARSESLWERRIAIIATYFMIKRDDLADTLAISEVLLKDTHDLIHKAVGWMLRELGNRDLEREKQFLDRHAAVMPRTMLRYAIERFPNDERRAYLSR